MTKTVKAKRARRSEGQWRGLLARHQMSGLDVKAFCRGERVSEASFYRWRAIVNGDRGDATGGDGGSAFLDLGALESVSAAKPKLDLRLDLGDGLILHLVRH